MHVDLMYVLYAYSRVSFKIIIEGVNHKVYSRGQIHVFTYVVS